MGNHRTLCCLDDTTAPRGTKPSVVRYWANLVAGYLGAVWPRRRVWRLSRAQMPAHEAQALDAGTSDIGRPWEREMAVRVMTGYVAHELNHPLGTIINLANILSRRLADPVVRSKDIREHVKNIKAEAVRATSVIKNMRMLTEHKPVAHESLSLVEVCHDTIARMKPLAKSKQVKIRFEVRTALVRVHGVKELLETALCNFIINSITALDDLANVTSRLVIIRILTP